MKDHGKLFCIRSVIIFVRVELRFVQRVKVHRLVGRTAKIVTRPLELDEFSGYYRTVVKHCVDNKAVTENRYFLTRGKLHVHVIVVRALVHYLITQFVRAAILTDSVRIKVVLIRLPCGIVKRIGDYVAVRAIVPIGRSGNATYSGFQVRLVLDLLGEAVSSARFHHVPAEITGLGCRTSRLAVGGVRNGLVVLVAS